MAASDILAALGLPTGTGTPSTTGDPSLLGLTPDQNAAMQQLQNQAAMKSIIPTLFALGVGVASSPRYYGSGGALLRGAVSGANAYGNAYQQNIQTPLEYAKLAAALRHQQTLETISAQKQADMIDLTKQQRDETARHNLIEEGIQQQNADTSANKADKSVWEMRAPIPTLMPDGTIRNKIPWYNKNDPDPSHVIYLDEGAGVPKASAAPPVGGDPFKQLREQYKDKPDVLAYIPPPEEAGHYTANQVNSRVSMIGRLAEGGSVHVGVSHPYMKEDGTIVEMTPIVDKKGNVTTYESPYRPILPGEAANADPLSRAVKQSTGYKNVVTAYNAANPMAPYDPNKTDAEKEKAFTKWADEKGFGPLVHPDPKAVATAVASAMGTPSATPTPTIPATPSATPTPAASPSAAPTAAPTLKSGDTVPVPPDKLSQLPEGQPMHVRIKGVDMVVVRKGDTVIVQ